MRKIIILSLLFILFHEGTLANTVNKKDNVAELYKMFDINVYSLSKKNEDAFDAASSIYVLTSEDIRRSGVNSLPEVLRLVPGLQVARIDGHKWAISARGFNGQYSNKMLIMVDGRIVYTPLFLGAVWDIQDYVLDDIEKIEVIRGSGGAIWGANAVNGIINIITKNSADTQGTYISGTIGNQDRSIVEARYGGATKNLNHYRIYAKQANRDQLHRLSSNTKNDDGYQQTQAGFRYDVRSIKNNSVRIFGDLRSSKANSYFDLPNAQSGKEDKNSKGANINIGWDKTISNKASFTLQSYFDYTYSDAAIVEVKERITDVDFQYFYDWDNHNQSILGAGYRLINDNIREISLTNSIFALDYNPNERNDEILSAFLQQKIGLINDVLYLTIGSKFEYNNYTGNEYQPSAKLTYFPSRNQTLWSSVSRAVRTPTRAEKTINVNKPTNPSAGATIQAGDRGFESENVIAYELGYRVKPTGRSLIDIAAFYNDYSDLRTFNSKNGLSSVSTNFGEGESYGAELTAKWQIIDDLRLEAGYDFLKIDVRNKNISSESSAFPIHLTEGQSPENQFRLRANYNITPKIEFDNIVYYVDSVEYSSSTSNNLRVPSYIRYDTRLGFFVTPDFDLSVGAQNLTDRRHVEFDGGLFANRTEIGRTVYFKAVFRFW